MVNNNKELDAIFRALADKTRRSIMLQLAKSDCRVTELAAPYDQSLASISKHLKVLEQAKLLTKSKEGRVITCRADLRALDAVYKELESLGAFWRERLDSLESFLEETQHEASKGETHDKSRSRK